MRASLLSFGLTVGLAIAPSMLLAKEFAILIGVGEYPHLPAEQQLRSPVADVLKVKDFLVDNNWFQENQIIPLLNKNATSDAIVTTVLAVAEKTQPGDKIFFYFSGHGTRTKDTSGDETDGFDEVLLTYDYGAPETEDDDRVTRGYLHDDFISRLMEKLAGRDVTVIIDACHSGTSTRGQNVSLDDDVLLKGVPFAGFRGASRDPAKSAAEMSYIENPQTSHKIWAAAAPEQYAWESGRTGGVFTNYFLEGLSSKNADSNGNGVITSAELIDYTRVRSEAWCENATKCKELGKGFTPNYEGPADVVMMSYATDVGSNVPVVSGQPPETETDADNNTDGTNDTNNSDAQDLTLADLLGATNTAQLLLEVSDGPDMRVGQSVQFQLRTERPGTLLVFDIDPNGHLLQLSPSVISRPGIERVAANTPIFVPEGLSKNGKPIKLEVTEPSGTGQLVALLIEDENIDIQDLLGRNFAGEPIKNARSFLVSLAERLRRMQAQDGVNRAVNWSSTYLTYTISK